MTSGTFEAELNAIFTKGHHKLTARDVESKVDTSELLIKGESTAMRDLHLALQDVEVCRCLKSWPHGELLVSVQGSGWVAPVPAVLIRDGAVYLVSDSPGAAEKVEVPASFAEWFEGLIGAPPPFPLDLGCRDTNLWGSSETQDREVLGLPHVMRIAESTSYTLAGYGGYGSNSYALFFTRVSGPTRMYLRLPWGGAYMDPEEKRPTLLGALGAANALFEMAESKQLPMWLNNNMGLWYAAVVPEPKSNQRVWTSLGLARRYVETGTLEAIRLGGTSTQPKTPEQSTVSTKTDLNPIDGGIHDKLKARAF